MVQLGIAKFDSKKMILEDTDLYLHFLLPTASFQFESVSDQISQQKYMSMENSAIFFRIIELITKAS